MFPFWGLHTKKPCLTRAAKLADRFSWILSTAHEECKQVHGCLSPKEKKKVFQLKYISSHTKIHILGKTEAKLLAVSLSSYWSHWSHWTSEVLGAVEKSWVRWAVWNIAWFVVNHHNSYQHTFPRASCKSGWHQGGCYGFTVFSLLLVRRVAGDSRSWVCGRWISCFSTPNPSTRGSFFFLAERQGSHKTRISQCIRGKRN